MSCRGAFSKVAYFAVCVFLLLGLILIGLFVSATGSTPTTQPTQTFSPALVTALTPDTDSTPIADSTPVIDSTPASQSTRATFPVSIAQSTPTMVVPDTADEATNGTFIVLPQEISVHVGDTFSVFVFAENVTNMYGWQVILSFDPTIVECVNVSVSNQQVFSDRYPVSQALIDFNSTEFTKRPLQSIQNSEGFVLAGDCLLGRNQTTFYGSGFLYKATFKALSAGSSTLALPTDGVQSFTTYYLDAGQDPLIPSLSSSSISVLTK